MRVLFRHAGRRRAGAFQRQEDQSGKNPTPEILAIGRISVKKQKLGQHIRNRLTVLPIEKNSIRADFRGGRSRTGVQHRPIRLR